MKLSIILPTYNESGNIVELIKCIMHSLPKQIDFEIIVVDDNSPDDTFKIVQNSFKENDCIISILRTTDRGLAKSIRAGIEKASGDQVLVMDTDFTHDPAEIPKMLHVAEVYDIVNGSRFCAGGNMEDLFHYLLSMIYNWIIRVVLRTQIQDNLGGFFTMKKNKLYMLPFDLIFHGYGDYFFRLLNYSQRIGLSVIEVPAFYHTRRKGSSKSKFIRLLFSYTVSAVKFRIAMLKQ